MTLYRYTVTREYVGTIEASTDDGDDYKDYVEDLVIEDVDAGFSRDKSIVDIQVEEVQG